MKGVINNIYLPLDAKESALEEKLCRMLGSNASSFSYKVLRKSIDTRKGWNSFVYKVLVESLNELHCAQLVPFKEQEPLVIPPSKLTSRPLIVGFGPSGIFAALVLARAGAKPVVVEQGKAVNEREADINALQQRGIFDPFSNVAYGEGGAGTFSDGKLNTGVNSPYSSFVLEEFVAHGAKADILSDALPHIGSDYLKKIIPSFREEIISLGGEIRFQTRLIDIQLSGNIVSGALLLDKDGNQTLFETNRIILACGHSAYPLISTLTTKGLFVKPKDFSVGLRLENLQSDINESAYHEEKNNPYLPPASYKSVAHLPSGRGVYSFCMCPGGVVMNSSSYGEEIVTNGMSENLRDGKNGNAAILVSVKVDDYFKGNPLDGFAFQNDLERKAFRKDKPYFAPSCLVGDFLRNRASPSFKNIKPSYRPGVYLAKLQDFLPNFVVSSLLEAWPILAQKQKMFRDFNAVLTGVETRSSSPISIPRDDSFQSSIFGLYPVGEGASYAGGITSSALDGIKVALAILNS